MVLSLTQYFQKIEKKLAPHPKKKKMWTTMMISESI